MALRNIQLVVALFLGWVFSIPVYTHAFEPAKTVDVVVHTAAGGGSDIFARAIAEMIQKEKLVPQRLQVVNKSGGGSAVAMSYLKEKKADTHTIGFFTGVWITNPLTSKEATATIKDLTPIVRLVLEPAVVAVKADSPYKSMKDFVEDAKKKPGQLRQSGGSVTGRDNLVRLVIEKATGAKWVYVSFPGGGERIANLLGGHVHMMVMEPQEAGEHIKAGNLRVIAALTEKRLPSFPDVSTIKEQGIDVPIIPQTRGIVAPPGVGTDVVKYWEGVFGRFVKTPAWKKYLSDNQLEDGYLTGSTLVKFFDDLSVQMRGILKEAGVKVVR
jgi:putative tricarboxylic transport membrane protein